ncbi:MAG: DUF2336 domain-containing protein [Alphaproteobacteria bacterium]|nr:DUF2336 domain-containing protein [Alphaproteobacteria bacterium]
MSLGILDKSSGITPLLVRLYDSQRLHSLPADKKPQAQAELLSAVGELFALELSHKETELIADVLTDLIRQAELDVRQALSERLAVLDNVPIRIAHQIAYDEISVADVFLSQSPVLDDQDLLYIIKTKSAAYWRAVACRKGLGDDIIDMLADTKNPETALALVENSGITLTPHSLLSLSDMVQQHEFLATPLLSRAEITSDIIVRVYGYVGEEIKRQIREQHPLASAALSETVDEIVAELAGAAEESSSLPTPAMLRAADRYREKGLLTMKLMLGTLRRGQIPSFIAQFSRFTGMSAEVTVGVLGQSSGQGLAVACRAHDILKTDFVSIYLLTHRIRGADKMIDMKDLKRAVDYYTHIRPDVARSILAGSARGPLGGAHGPAGQD